MFVTKRNFESDLSYKHFLVCDFIKRWHYRYDLQNASISFFLIYHRVI